MSDTARVSVEGGLGAKPEVLLPAGDPPPELLIHDVIEGDGAAAEPGATSTRTTSGSAGTPSASSTPRGTAGSRSSSR